MAKEGGGERRREDDREGGGEEGEEEEEEEEEIQGRKKSIKRHRHIRSPDPIDSSSCAKSSPSLSLSPFLCDDDFDFAWPFAQSNIQSHRWKEVFSCQPLLASANVFFLLR